MCHLGDFLVCLLIISSFSIIGSFFNEVSMLLHFLVLTYLFFVLASYIL